MFMLFFFLMIRRPPRSTLFPTRRSSDLICPAEATKAATMRLFGVEAARCRVIPHGVETEFALPASPSVRAEVQTRYALPDRYVLQVGTVQPRKNYITTLRALARIPAPERVPLSVVCGL